MDRLLTAFFVLLALPFLIGLALQAFTAALVALLPLIISVAILVGITAWGTAGLILLRRLPPRSRGGRPDDEFPIPPPEPVRRPRGPRREY